MLSLPHSSVHNHSQFALTAHFNANPIHINLYSTYLWIRKGIFHRSTTVHLWIEKGQSPPILMNNNSIQFQMHERHIKDTYFCMRNFYYPALHKVNQVSVFASFMQECSSKWYTHTLFKDVLCFIYMACWNKTQC